MAITAQPRKILSEVFAQRLADLGIIQDLGSVQRVVIDAQAGHLLMVHVQYVGDERLLDVVPTLDGVEVRTGG